MEKKQIVREGKVIGEMIRKNGKWVVIKEGFVKVRGAYYFNTFGGSFEPYIMISDERDNFTLNIKSASTGAIENKLSQEFTDLLLNLIENKPRITDELKQVFLEAILPICEKFDKDISDAIKKFDGGAIIMMKKMLK